MVFSYRQENALLEMSDGQAKLGHALSWFDPLTESRGDNLDPRVLSGQADGSNCNRSLLDLTSKCFAFPGSCL